MPSFPYKSENQVLNNCTFPSNCKNRSCPICQIYQNQTKNSFANDLLDQYFSSISKHFLSDHNNLFIIPTCFIHNNTINNNEFFHPTTHAIKLNTKLKILNSNEKPRWMFESKPNNNYNNNNKNPLYHYDLLAVVQITPPKTKTKKKTTPKTHWITFLY